MPNFANGEDDDGPPWVCPDCFKGHTYKIRCGLPRIETFKSVGGHSPEIRGRTSKYEGTVTPVEAYIDGSKLTQIFEYIDGPKKGERVKITTLLMPISKVDS